MNRENTFWGLILVIVGVLFLADNLGIISFSFNLLWPLLIVGLGIYILLGRNQSSSSVAPETVTIPLDGATEAHIKLEHGAGRLQISGAAPKDQLLAGSFDAMRLNTRKDGTKISATLQTAVEDSVNAAMPWNWNRSRREWDFSLNSEIPISLKIDTGASDSRLDLSETKVTSLDIDTGASSTKLVTPKNAGHTQVDISGGAASFDITIPAGVAARIRVDSGLGSVSVDEKRFPRAGKGFESADYTNATNKLDLRLEVGVSSVSIK